MAISRREFFRLSGSGLAAGVLGLSLEPVEAKAQDLQIRYAKEKGISPVNLTTNGLTLDNPALENGKRVPGMTGPSPSNRSN